MAGDVARIDGAAGQVMSPPVPRAAEWILTHLVQADAADVLPETSARSFSWSSRHAAAAWRGSGTGARLSSPSSSAACASDEPASQAEMLNAERDRWRDCCRTSATAFERW